MFKDGKCFLSNVTVLKSEKNSTEDNIKAMTKWFFVAVEMDEVKKTVFQPSSDCL